MWTPFLSRDQKKPVKRKKDWKKEKEKTNSVLPAQYDLEENTQPGFPQLVALPKAPHKHAIALSSSSASQLSILQTPTKPKPQGKVLHHQNPLKTNISVQALFMHACKQGDGGEDEDRHHHPQERVSKSLGTSAALLLLQVRIPIMLQDFFWILGRRRTSLQVLQTPDMAIMHAFLAHWLAGCYSKQLAFRCIHPQKCMER